MEIVSSKFTVLFEEPFWIGLYERQEGRQYEVCKITFGSQPQDCQVLEFLLQNWDRLRFSPPSVNPKRMQRAIQRQVRPAGIGTKAQQALKRQQEQKRQDRKGHSRAQRSAQKERRLSQRQEKRRQKHRGH